MVVTKVDVIDDMRNRGMSDSTIARFFHVTRVTIRDWAGSRKKWAKDNKGVEKPNANRRLELPGL